MTGGPMAPTAATNPVFPPFFRVFPHGPAMTRRGASLLAAAEGRQGHLSRPATRWRRGFPGPASTTQDPHCCTPVPTPFAHPIPRAIRVRRSPR